MPSIHVYFRPGIRFIAALILPMIGASWSIAQEAEGQPGVVLILPPHLNKYAAKMPTHVPVIRADQEGKQTAAKTITGRALPDAKAAGKSRFFFLLDAPKSSPGNATAWLVVKTTYKLYYRSAKGYEEICKGEVATTAFASPFVDGAAEHYSKFGERLSVDVSRALARKVLEEKEIKVPAPPHRRESPQADPESPRERVAYKVDRKTVGEEVFFTFMIHNRLPVQVRVREMEIVNTVTGQCHTCTPSGEGEPWIFEGGKRAERGARMPANLAPLEAQAVRMRELFLILPE